MVSFTIAGSDEAENRKRATEIITQGVKIAKERLVLSGTLRGTGLLILLGLLTYGAGIVTPSLFGDDWGHVIRQPIDGLLQCPNQNGFFLRPLNLCWFLGLNYLFGFNLVVYKLISFALTLLTAVLLYLLLNSLLPHWPLFNLVVAALFLVYPTNYSHLWIVKGYHKFAFILFLIGSPTHNRG